MNARIEARRRFVVLATAMSLVLSLIGGSTVLLFSGERPQRPVAIKPIPTPAPVPTPEPAPPTSESTDLSMFGFGDSGVDLSTPDTSGNAFADSGGFGSGGGGLPSFQLPSGPTGPAAPPIDWNALLYPLVQNYTNAQAANIAGSITGSVTGAVVSVLNSAAILLGDLILFAAISNNGPAMLGELQGALTTAFAAAGASALAAGVPQIPVAPDLSGLTAAFAAAAAAPPIGVPALPQLPPLPTPEQLAAGLAGLSALSALPALPALPPIGLPQLPPPPGLPTPDQVAVGIGVGVGLLAIPVVLGALFPPPSITRMLGLPF